MMALLEGLDPAANGSAIQSHRWAQPIGSGPGGASGDGENGSGKSTLSVDMRHYRADEGDIACDGPLNSSAPRGPEALPMSAMRPTPRTCIRISRRASLVARLAALKGVARTDGSTSLASDPSRPSSTDARRPIARPEENGAPRARRAHRGSHALGSGEPTTAYDEEGFGDAPRFIAERARRDRPTDDGDAGSGFRSTRWERDPGALTTINPQSINQSERPDGQAVPERTEPAPLRSPRHSRTMAAIFFCADATRRSSTSRARRSEQSRARCRFSGEHRRKAGAEVGARATSAERT